MLLKKYRTFRRWALCFIAVLVVSVIVVANGCTQWLSYAIVYAPTSDKPIDPADDPTSDDLAALGIDRQLRVDVGPPQASLLVWVIEAGGSKPQADRSTATVIVLHGINDNIRSMIGFAKSLSRSGYRVVLVDLRGHGRSTGAHITFGARESHDLSQVIDVLEQQRLVVGRLGVFGPSYGGAAALQWAAIDHRVKAVVTVSTFTSMRDVVPGYVRRYAPVVGWLMAPQTIDHAVTEAGRLAGFDPDEANVLNAIARTKAKVLLIHGTADRKIPPSNSKALRAAAPEHSQLFLIEGASHDSIMGKHGDRVLRHTLTWFDQWLSKKRAR